MDNIVTVVTKLTNDRFSIQDYKLVKQNLTLWLAYINLYNSLVLSTYQYIMAIRSYLVDTRHTFCGMYENYLPIKEKFIIIHPLSHTKQSNYIVIMAVSKGRHFNLVNYGETILISLQTNHATINLALNLLQMILA